MTDIGAGVGRRAVLGGIGAIAVGGSYWSGRAPSVTRASATGRSLESTVAVGGAAVFPTVFKHHRLPAAAFRPATSTAVWQITNGALHATGSATYVAPVVPTEGDLIEELQVVLDPGGQSGAISLSRYRPGSVEDLVSGTYPATNGVTTVALPLPDRPHIAEPSVWSYSVNVALSTGAVLHSALLESFSATATLVLIDPVRVWDSRDADPYKLQPGVSSPGKLASGNAIGFSLQGVVPTYNYGALVNVTIAETESSGYLTVYGPGEHGEAPPTSNINWYAANQIVANLVATKLGGEATLAIRAGGSGRTHVIVDVLGYFV